MIFVFMFPFEQLIFIHTKSLVMDRGLELKRFVCCYRAHYLRFSLLWFKLLLIFFDTWISLNLRQVILSLDFFNLRPLWYLISSEIIVLKDIMVVELLLLSWLVLMLMHRFNLFLLIIVYLKSGLVVLQSDIVWGRLLLFLQRVDLSPLLFQDVASALKEGVLGKD